MQNILFIDDDERAGQLFKRFVNEDLYRVDSFTDPLLAVKTFDSNDYDIVITDLKMPSLTGMQVLSIIRGKNAEIPVIIVTGYSTVDDAVDALRLGASDFIKKPYDTEELLLQIDRTLQAEALKKENKQLKKELVRLRSQDMIGESAAMVSLKAMIARIANIRCNVIINGESGTGKELVAKALHNQDDYSEQPFVIIDCGALTDSLLESELFGHEKGAFTGADNSRTGLLETAAGGTVFLDEIGNISDALQTRLLRVVQEKQLTRVGGVTPINIDVRFIVATNRDLPSMVAQGKFREDLYHRLNVVTIDVPTLRERRDDIPLLINYFIDQFSRQYNRKVGPFSHSEISKLQAYSWPGNIRQCRNLVERLVVISDGEPLTLDNELQSPGQTPHSDTPSLQADNPDLKTLERRYILNTLERCGQSRGKTAKILGINVSTLWRKLQSYDTTDR